MKCFALIVLTATPFLLTDSPLFAQRVYSSGQIDVQIRNPDGSPARRGIHVLLESGEGGVVDDCRTVEKGKCTFTAGTGIYVVRLNETGYRPLSVRVELTGITRQFVMIDLKPLEEVPIGLSRRRELHLPEHGDVVTHAYRIDVPTLRYIATSREITVHMPQESLDTPFAVWEDGRSALGQFLDRSGSP